MTMTTMPSRIASLPRNDAGYPVPYFVEWRAGVPDFRVTSARKIMVCHREHRCWICGTKITSPTSAFTIGPMCAVNRVSAEPPSHRECSLYAATACPFLANPKKRRRVGGLPEERAVAGVMIERNPGVTLVWCTRSYEVMQVDNGVLFRIGEPTKTLWFAEGREATREEVEASIDSGLPILREMAEAQGHGAVEHLETLVAAAVQYLP